MIQRKFTHGISLTVTTEMYTALKAISDEKQCSIAEVIRDFIEEGTARMSASGTSVAKELWRG